MILHTLLLKPTLRWQLTPSFVSYWLQWGGYEPGNQN